MNKTIDSSHNYLFTVVKELKASLDTGRYRSAESGVKALVNCLLNANSPGEDVFLITPQKRTERESFVELGGMHQLMRFFRKPFGHTDARLMEKTTMIERGDLWNEVLVLMREICYTIPHLSEKIFSKDAIIFLFTLMSHACVFENAATLLEEVLKVRLESFNIGLVPKLYDLIGTFTIHQYAHFSRILSLVLHDPEDRQIMEGAHVLRCHELLQLRRDRMARANTVVEKNQTIMLSCPNMLERYVQILRILNQSPKLADVIKSGILGAQSPITGDVLTFSNATWDDFVRLESQAGEEEGGCKPRRFDRPRGGAEVNAHLGSSWVIEKDGDGGGGDSQEQSSTDSDDDPPTMIEDDITPRLLEAFSPLNENNLPEIGAVYSTMVTAVSLGVGRPTQRGIQLLTWVTHQMMINGTDESRNSEDSMLDSETLRMAYDGRMFDSHSTGGARGRGPWTDISKISAKSELKFHAMLLIPHQIEILFVLCTLLTGRRKIDVQKSCAHFGLSDVLHQMFDRLSWGDTTTSVNHGLEHIHGPGCECNPESQLRVQYLRLVHNFFDHDFQYKFNKGLLLSKQELHLIKSHPGRAFLSCAFNLPERHRGLLSKIISTLLVEPPTSPYRFWLSCCVEAYLRGASCQEQLFAARCGVVNYIVKLILENDEESQADRGKDKSIQSNSNLSLQSAFDLLGELVKYNMITFEMVDAALGEEEFRRFLDRAMLNLVESNVFIRSLYISLETFHEHQEEMQEKRQDVWGSRASPAYLTHSWLHFSPEPLSTNAIAKTRGLSANSFHKRPPVGTIDQIVDHRGSKHSTRVIINESRLQNTQRHLLATGNPTGQSESAPGVVDRWDPYKLEQNLVVTRRQQNRQDGREQDPLELDMEDDEEYSELLSAIAAGGGIEVHEPLKNDKSEGSPERHVALQREGGSPLQRIGDNLREAWSTVSDMVLNSGGENGEESHTSFYTPPETPKYSSASSSVPKEREHDRELEKVRCESTSSLDALKDLALTERSQGQCGTEAEENVQEAQREANEENKSQSQPLDEKTEGHVALPDGIFRLSAFLAQERDNIVLLLMDVVTLRVINHENICCLNTLLLMLLLARRHGTLEDVLCRVRLLADKRVAMSATNRALSRMDSLDEEDEAEEERAGEPSTEGGGPPGGRGANLLMANFRELLWFWDEYYLRRGRDRLSLEFSSQIPFSYWHDLVKELCRDDGSACALLKRPLKAYNSPYTRMSRYHTSGAPEFINNRGGAQRY